MCAACWAVRFGEKEPVRVKGADVETCCYCGGPAGAGIYVRDDPKELRCLGNHAEWAEDPSLSLSELVLVLDGLELLVQQIEHYEEDNAEERIAKVEALITKIRKEL